jgi:hypothetical protein
MLDTPILACALISDEGDMSRIIPIFGALPEPEPEPEPAREPLWITRWPVLGRLLRKGWLMTGLRVMSLLLLVVAIATGLATEDARIGLSVLLMWGIFWPLFTAVVTPTLGNAFCAVCPHGFVGKWLSRVGLRRSFPRQLRGIWISLVVVVLGYWVVSFSMPGLLSSSTRGTAWYFLGFTVIAFGVFFVFKDMAWCKHLCPLGRLLASHGRIGVLRIETDQRACAECRSFECAKACSYHLSPFRFAERNDMGACTLCTDCVTACDSVHLAATAPGKVLRKPIQGQDRDESWIFIVILGVVIIGLQFLHGLRHTSLEPYLPWLRAGDWLHGFVPLDADFFDLGRFLALASATLLTVLVALWGYGRVARLSSQEWRRAANSMACALAPLVLLPLIPRAVSRFATNTAHELVNHSGALVGLQWDMAPLAQRGDAWLEWLPVLPYLGAAWALWLVWQRAGVLVQSNALRWQVWMYGSAPVWLYLAVIGLKLAAPWLVPDGAGHVH